MQNIRSYLEERKEIKKGRMIMVAYATLTVVYFGIHFIIYLNK